jgi:hypothetical protein
LLPIAICCVVAAGCSSDPGRPRPPAAAASLAVHRYWQNSDAETGFDFGRDSIRVEDFVAHDAGAWASQGARFKRSRPNARALFYADFGTAGDGLATVLDLSTARAKNGWDAVFADDVNAWFSFWPDESIDGYAGPLDYWEKAVLPLLARVHSHLAADKNGTLVANVGEWPGHPELDSVFGVADGALQEFFLVWGDGTSLQPAEVENEYASLRAAVQRGKTYYAIVHRTDEQGLDYAFCAAAIMAGRRSGLVRVTHQVASGTEPMAWSPVLARRLGLPAGPVNHEPGSTAWERSFSGNRVLKIDTRAQRCEGL